jgi:ribonuclease-3
VSAELYLQALTTKAWAHENPLPGGGLPAHYERLEFLGDAVLELCVREVLLERFGGAEEGDLTFAKQHLVMNEALPPICDRIGAYAAARKSEGHRNDGPRAVNALKADLVEALLGALYLDRGLDAAREVVRSWFGDLELKRARRTRHPKVVLQEYSQRSFAGENPAYALVAEGGPSNEPEFVFSVEIGGRVVGEGRGSSKDRARRAAAADAVDKLGLDEPGA